MPPGLLAYGGHLKNTIALTTREGVVLSQHIGDLETAEARVRAGARRRRPDRRSYATPATIAVRDLHPRLSRQPRSDGQRPAGHRRPASSRPRRRRHGRARRSPDPSSACRGTAPAMAATGRCGAASFSRVDDDGWRRVAALRPFRLPGGEAAIREPRRAAFGLLYDAFGRDALAMTDLAPVASFSAGRARHARRHDRPAA